MANQAFSTKASDQQDLTPQQEYWLNRFLREYSSKVFFVIVLFILSIFAVALLAGNSNSSTSNTVLEVTRQ